MKIGDHHPIAILTQLQTLWSEQLALTKLVISTSTTGIYYRISLVEKRVRSSNIDPITPEPVLGRTRTVNIKKKLSPEDMINHMNRENTSTRKNLRLSIHRMTVNEEENTIQNDA